jgi:hypothetical protein
MEEKSANPHKAERVRVLSSGCDKRIHPLFQFRNSGGEQERIGLQLPLFLGKKHVCEENIVVTPGWLIHCPDISKRSVKIVTGLSRGNTLSIAT